LRVDEILTAVVAFEPDENSIAKIAQLHREVGRLLVVDNSFTSAAIARVKRICDADGINLLQKGSNRGQAEALNRACEWAQAHGYGFVLFFDQDTRVLPGFMDQLLACAEQLPSDPTQAVLGCDYLSPRRLSGKPGVSVSKKRAVITSASLVSISLWQRVGRFREDFFIDHVDDEFCLRARRAGGSVWRLDAPLIEHRIGTGTVSRWSRNHSAFRWYHIIRNHLWTLREYWSFDPIWAAHTLVLKVRFVLGSLILEAGRAEKARAMLRGLRDGLLTRPERPG
jgi:rhamnosyltransferase